MDDVPCDLHTRVQQVKNGPSQGVSEDEVFAQQGEVQELTDSFVAQATTLVDEKVEQIMTP